MMEEASISETQIKFYQATQHNNPEDSHLCTHRCENLKSHMTSSCLIELREDWHTLVD
jgi:hypothetical protein